MNWRVYDRLVGMNTLAKREWSRDEAFCETLNGEHCDVALFTNRNGARIGVSVDIQDEFVEGST